MVETATDAVLKATASASVKALVTAEIAYAETRFGKGYASAHEAYAVLLEEVEEFWAEVKKKRSERDKRLMVEELVQVACVAQRYAAQLVEEQGGLVCPCGDPVEVRDATSGVRFCRDCQEGLDGFDQDHDEAP